MKKWVPNFLTSLNLCFGVLAIMLVDPYWSTVCIIFSGICDVFDGYSARVLNVQSETGKELDSLADLISFGFAPVYILQSVIPISRELGIAVVICGSLCAALRLARYNTMENSDFFVGLPSPAHGFLIMGLVLTDLGELPIPNLAIAISAICFSLLMVTQFRFPSFKSIRSHPTSSIPLIIAVLAAIFILIFRWEYALLVGMLTYLLFSTYYWVKSP